MCLGRIVKLKITININILTKPGLYRSLVLNAGCEEKAVETTPQHCSNTSAKQQHPQCTHTTEVSIGRRATGGGSS